MAAFNFPNSPSVNDIHSQNGVSWKWNGTIWARVGDVNAGDGSWWDQTSTGINTTTKVGIGTTNPIVSLEVRGSGANGQIYLGGSTGAHSQIYSDSDGILILSADQSNSGSNSYLGFSVDNTEKARITADGPHLLLGGTSDVNEITESSSNAGMVIGSTSYGNAGLAIITSNSGAGRL